VNSVTIGGDTRDIR